MGKITKNKTIIIILISGILVSGSILTYYFVIKNTEKDSREHIYTDGFNLNTNENQTYDNVILHIRGEIALHEFSTLNISNTKIIAELDYHKEFYLTVSENASLFIDNCEFESDQWRFYNFRYFHNATVFIHNFQHTGIPWQSCEDNVNLTLINAGAGVTFSSDFEGSISVSNSDFVYFEILLESGEYDLTFPNGHVNNWELNVGHTHILVSNSEIHRMDIDLYPGVNATLRNLAEFSFGWIFGGGWGHPTLGEDVSIDGLLNKYYADEIFHGDNSYLRLINTTLTNGWWPIVNGQFHLSVSNSDLTDPWAYGNSVLSIDNSNIYYISATENAYVSITDCTIENSIVALQNAVIECTNIEFDGNVQSDPSASVKIDGELV